MNQKDLDFIEYHETSGDETKFVLIQLQRIWNTFKSDQDEYCMCTASERRDYKRAFYMFWNMIKDDVKKLDGTI